MAGAIVIGLIALLAGIGGGIATMFKQLRPTGERGLALPAFPTETLKALTEFLKALTAAPPWLALTIIGLILIIYGGTLV